jgi:hypothetical protein
MSDVFNFDSMVKQFKDFGELKEYSNAQFNTIIELNKQINKLKEENEHLQRLLETGVAKQSAGDLSPFVLSPEEEICLTQLRILNDISKRSSLTLEECRKVEIYSKVLNSLRNAPKEIKGEHKSVDTKELLKLAESIGNESEK